MTDFPLGKINSCCRYALDPGLPDQTHKTDGPEIQHARPTAPFPCSISTKSGNHDQQHGSIEFFNSLSHKETFRPNLKEWPNTAIFQNILVTISV